MHQRDCDDRKIQNCMQTGEIEIKRKFYLNRREFLMAALLNWKISEMICDFLSREIYLKI
jgi:hypothetical protein